MAVGVTQTATVTADGELFLWGTTCFDVSFFPKSVDGFRAKRVEKVFF